MAFEVIKIQSLIQGFQQRNIWNKKISSVKIIQLFEQLSIQRKNAASRIQNWFRLMLVRRRERMIFEKRKRAALIIERFFIWVSEEVEREIERREKLKLVKRQKRESKKKKAEDALLENIWIKTINTIDQQSKAASANKNRMKPDISNGNHMLKVSRQRSLSRKWVDKHDSKKIKSSTGNLTFNQKSKEKSTAPPQTRFSFYDPTDVNAPLPPTHTVNMSLDSIDSHSDVSGITTPTLHSKFQKMHSDHSRKSSRASKNHSEREMRSDPSTRNRYVTRDKSSSRYSKA